LRRGLEMVGGIGLLNLSIRRRMVRVKTAKRITGHQTQRPDGDWGTRSV